MADTTLPALLDTGTHAARPAATAVGSGALYSCTDHSLIYQSDGATWSTWATLGTSSGISATIVDAKGDLIVATAADTVARRAVGANGTVLTADSAESTGVKWATPGSGIGNVTVAMPHGMSPFVSSTTNSTAQRAGAVPVQVPGQMLVRALWVNISAAGTGLLQWGLFDYSSSASAATKLAGGAVAPGGTGFRELVADSAPVTVGAGNYMLILFNPAANASTIHVQNLGASAGFWKAWTTYTWDDTPDFTSASWTDATGMYHMYLEGDLLSGTRW